MAPETVFRPAPGILAPMLRSLLKTETFIGNEVRERRQSVVALIYDCPDAVHPMQDPGTPPARLTDYGQGSGIIRWSAGAYIR
ncbi:hypothetical protein CFR80_11680 [Komagataeibacter oboediens]|uniref:Uncharacterized protein n=1 Tax=Komagataeibacter oboediens TaxID=65958 RepID=A0A318QPM3_9PROT|nr:hypothetical protein CFR80_11680 [Komagataeibacter oboediens]